MNNSKKVNRYLLFLLPAACCLLPILTGCAVPKKRPELPLPERIKKISKPKKVIAKKIIKIGIIENTGYIAIGAEDDFIITDIKTGKKTKMSADNIYSVKVIRKKIAFDKKRFQSTVKITPKTAKYKISVNGKKYRGSIILKAKSKNKITVINELDIEKYVCGVVPKEVGPGWHIEALKAQAVVARTFALKNLGKHSKNGFDLCAKTHCQVYGGASSEKEKTNKAVYNTAGKVLVYDGEMISSYYHSSCAGRTEDVKNVWGNSKSSNPEYLSGVKCRFCKNYKWYNWRYKILLNTIASRLRRAGYRVGKVKKIKTVGRTSSARVKKVLIKHSKGKLRLSSHKFRMAIGPNKIRGTNFVIKSKKSVAYFKGHGWGHGVGMCQWGAKGMAERGWNYKKILRHYYKGTKIMKRK